MRFSLRTMTSGACRSISFLRRLLRLMTRRYRSFKSEVAKRPPSSGTSGRSSGGMTGITSRIIHSGLLPDLRNESTTLSRFENLSFFCWVIDVDLLEQSFDGFRPHLADLVGELAGELLLELPVALVGDHLALFERKAQAVDVLLVRDDDVILEVENLLEFAQGDVEQVADAARQTFEEPDVRAGAGQLDVAQPLAADFRLCDLDAAFVADHAAVLHAFVFSAQALPVGYRAEDARAEQAVALGFECAVVDRFRFSDVAVRPRTNLLGRSEADANRFEIRCKRLLSCISNHFTYSPL